MNNKTLVITTSLLKETLPILEKDLEKQYKKQIALFKKLITEKDENRNFFASPVDFLKKNGALSYEKIQLSDGTIIPVIDNEIIAATIRKARDLYKKGKIAVEEIRLTFIYETKEASIFAVRNESVESTRNILLKEHVRTKEATFVRANERVFYTKEGRNILEVDGIGIGPLVNPKVFTRTRKQLAKFKYLSATRMKRKRP